MTWTFVFQIFLIVFLAMVTIVFVLGMYQSVVDNRHKHAVEMEMARHGHRVTASELVINTGTTSERELAARTDAALDQARQGRGL